MQPAEEGLVARWKFDEIGGATAADTSGYGNAGTLQGPARDTGRVGAGSLRFDGTDDQVTVASTQSVTEAANNFTLSFWAKPGATHELDAEGTTGAAGASGQKYAFSPNWYDAASGRAGAGVSVGTNGVSVYEHAGGYMPATLVHPTMISGWAHIAVVYANRRPSLYVNGVWQKDGQTSPKAYVHVTPANVAGGYPNNYFNGSLDDVRVYNRALAGEEITALAGSGGCFKDVEGFVSDFYQGALGRQPNGQELREWVSRLTQAQGYDQLLAEGKAMGRALFKSAEYAARGRTGGQYVGDLYRAYLQREPDQGGLDAWTNAVNADPVNGRETALRGFEESPEFADKLAKLCGTSAATGFNFTTAGLDAPNRTGRPGVDLRSGNYNWGLPILGLPGRAGHDLGLSLSYNSRVWTRDGSAVTFDPDGGFPSAGFRLGFPTVQPRHYNALTGKYAHTLVTPSGARVELRQIDATNAYESADSSHLRLENYGSTLALWTTDGTRMIYVLAGGDYQCAEVKDRNGNIISIAYDGAGQIAKITDTLGREIVFNYDTFQNLQSVVQKRKRAVAGAVVDDPHTVATFGYSDLTIQTNFSGMTVVG
ncbi:MAG: DUF4214 domain-containing protein, partial [Acidobacteria bacterium]|nr:DUF4214 domain-containing protein [Acidobacteriota bacterium]